MAPDSVVAGAREIDAIGHAAGMSAPRALLPILLLAACSDDADRVGGAAPDFAVVLPDARIEVIVPRSAEFMVGVRALRAWVERSALAVRAFYGRFPVPSLVLELVAEPTAVVGNAVTRTDGDGANITLGLGTNAGEAALRGDWVLVHEMIHTALPSLPPAQRWLEEGLATYLEGVIRCRAGLRDVRMFWGDFVTSAPEGLAKPEDGGLDGTTDWGRTYWGGATFCLLLDLAIRERTQDARGLRHALVAVLERGLDLRKDATLPEVLAILDAAIGAPVATELHAAHGSRRGVVDLAALWRGLGIESDGRRTRLSDSSPLAARRRAITTKDAP